MRIVFAGAGEFGLPSLKAVVGAGHEVALVVSQPDRPAGRGRKLTPTPIAQWALENGLPVERTADVNAMALPAADVMVVIALGQKIGPHVVGHPRLGSFNLHSSRLPKYRGAAPINWAVINGDEVTGNSIIRLADRMDAGAILAQSEVPIGELETAGELHDRLAENGAGLVLKCLQAHERGTVVEQEQDHARATSAPKLSREKAVLDWGRPARELANQIRGMYPWPGCRVKLIDGENEVVRGTLVRARAVAGNGEKGRVLASGAVAAGEGAVEVVEIQPEGKRPMPLAAFKNGHPWREGMRVESVQ